MVHEIKKVKKKDSVIIQICSCCRGDTYADYASDQEEHSNLELKKKMLYTFRSIPPLNVLHVFQKYNLKVLSEVDKNDVKIATKKKGDMRGAELLLDRLTLYDGWFECLVQVLRDDQVKLNGHAEIFEGMRDEVLESYHQIQLERSETSQEEQCTINHLDSESDDEAVELISTSGSSVSQLSILEKELDAERKKNNVSEKEKEKLKELLAKREDELQLISGEMKTLKDKVNQNSILESDGVQKQRSETSLASSLKIVDSDHSTGELLCKNCHAVVAMVTDLLSIPTDAALKKSRDVICKKRRILTQLFKNPQNAYFEMMTIKDSKVSRGKEKYSEHSWFAGFSWSYAHCFNCKVQLGWSFNVLSDSENSTSVEITSFYGFIYRKLKLQGDIFLCKQCSCEITTTKHVHTVPSESALRTEKDEALTLQLFKNPKDEFFDVITFLTAKVRTYAKKYIVNSWYPGFSWSFACCPNCNVQLGWTYYTVEDDFKPLIANVAAFDGLNMDKLYIKLAPETIINQNTI